MDSSLLKSPARRSKLLAAEKLNTSVKKHASVAMSPVLVAPETREHKSSTESKASTPVQPSHAKKKTPKQKVLSSPTFNHSVSTKPKRPTNVDIDEDDSEYEDIYSSVLKGGNAPQMLVDDWIEEYKKDCHLGIVNLFQFFLSSSGCKGKLSKEIVDNSSLVDIVRRMTVDFDEESSDYPLIKIGPQWKKFKTGFTDFIRVLIRQCQYNIVFDNFFLDRLIAFLTALSDSQVRAFRHTSTLAGLTIVSSLIDLSLSLNVNRANMQRQYQTERKKPADDRNSDRLDSLMETISELDSNEDEVKQFIMTLTKGIFVHRYRDVCASIRSLCMEQVGAWMMKMPVVFLSDSYLKYVGWTLFDKVNTVRLACLKTLLPLYNKAENLEKLHSFTSRFTDRFVQMTMDKDNDVAVEAVRLLTKLVEMDPMALESKHCEAIFDFVYGSQKDLAKAAGQFLYIKCFKTDPVDLTAPINKKKISPNRLRIRDLVEFLIESEFHEHASYLVDSLWEPGDMLRDWTAILAELTEPRNPPMNTAQETILLDILTCSVKQAITGDGPVGRQAGAHGNSLKLKAKQNRNIQRLVNERNRFTQLVMPVLPDLFVQYGISTSNLFLLLQLPLYMNLELYVTERQERKLDQFLHHLHDIVMKNSNEEILLKCSQVYEAMCDDSLNIAAKCVSARGALLDDIVANYQTASMAYLDPSTNSEDSESNIHSILNALKRVLCFNCCHDLSGLDLTVGLYTLSRDDLSDQCTVSCEVIAKSLTASAFNFMWKYNRVIKEPEKEEIIQLSNTLLAYINMCTSYTSHPSAHVSEEAYLTICDFLVVFSKHTTESEKDNYALASLTYQPDIDTIDALSNFLMKHVFTTDEDMDDEAKLESLHKRRNFLACYCKLLICNIIPIDNGAIVYQHYLTHFNDFADILKSTLAKLRQINRVNTAQMFTSVLKNEYLRLENDRNIELSMDSLLPVKELAKRLNLSFGLDLMRIRESVIALHTKGIQFCAERYREENSSKQPPSNILFLDLLVEFSGKLLRQDKSDLAKYASKVFSSANLNPSWESLHNYLSSLDCKLDKLKPAGDKTKRKDPNLTASTSFSSPKQRKSVKFSSTPASAFANKMSGASYAKKVNRDEPIEEDSENIPPTRPIKKRLVLDQSEFGGRTPRIPDSDDKQRHRKFGSLSTIGSPLTELAIRDDQLPSTSKNRSKRLLPEIADESQNQSPSKRRSLRSRNEVSYAE